MDGRMGPPRRQIDDDDGTAAGHEVFVLAFIVSPPRQLTSGGRATVE